MPLVSPCCLVTFFSSLFFRLTPHLLPHSSVHFNPYSKAKGWFEFALEYFERSILTSPFHFQFRTYQCRCYRTRRFRKVYHYWAFDIQMWWDRVSRKEKERKKERERQNANLIFFCENSKRTIEKLCVFPLTFSLILLVLIYDGYTIARRKLMNLERVRSFFLIFFSLVTSHDTTHVFGLKLNDELIMPLLELHRIIQVRLGS
jgi:hypothetical protein